MTDQHRVVPLRAKPAPVPRNPNRWLAYGIMLGAIFGYALDTMVVGLILGVIIGVALRSREQTTADEELTDAIREAAETRH